MIFGKSKLIDLKFNQFKIDKVDSYKYLGIIIHKSGKITQAIDDRIIKATRAMNMLQGALSTTRNVSVDIATSLFDKQVLPILTYGSIYWGNCRVYNKFYLNNIPSKFKSAQDLNKYLNINSVTSVRKIVNNDDTKPNCIRLTVTVNSYAEKIKILGNKNIDSKDFANDYDNHLCEKVHTKFLKFALGINKYASNHAIRAELGRYPLELKLNEKLVKYWHRIENYDITTYPLLTEAYSVSKANNHMWYQNIMNLFESNGLGYISQDPHSYSEKFIVNEINMAYENQYIQSWDAEARESPRYKASVCIKI